MSLPLLYLDIPYFYTFFASSVDDVKSTIFRSHQTLFSLY